MQNNGDGQGQQPTNQGDPGASPAGAQGDPGASQSTPPGTAAAGAGGDQQQQTPPQPPASTDPEDIAGLKSALAAERASARSSIATQRELQKKIDAYEREKQEAEDAKKDELTKAQEAAAKEKQRADDAEAKHRQAILRFEIARHATALGFHDPEDAYLMLDTAKVKYSEQGEPEGVDQLVKDLATAKPHLVKAAGAGQQTPNGAQAPSPSPSGAITGNQVPPDVDERRKQDMAQQVHHML